MPSIEEVNGDVVHAVAEMPQIGPMLAKKIVNAISSDDADTLREIMQGKTLSWWISMENFIQVPRNGFGRISLIDRCIRNKNKMKPCIRCLELLCNSTFYTPSDLETSTFYDVPPLVYATEKNAIEVVRVLIAAKAELEVRHPKSSDTALIAAASKFRFETCKMLAEAGANINALNYRGYTPLMASLGSFHSYKGFKENQNKVVGLLLDCKSDVSVVGKDGLNAMYFALKQPELRKRIAALEVEQAEGKEAIKNMVSFLKARDIEGMDTLLKKKSDIVNQTDIDGLSFLQRAATTGFVDGVRLLLSHDAQVNMRDRNGNSALAFAIMGNHFNCAHLLLTAGADTQLGNHKDMTPMMLAAQHCSLKDTKMIELLLEYGARTDHASKIASNRHHEKAVKKLKTTVEKKDPRNEYVSISVAFADAKRENYVLSSVDGAGLGPMSSSRQLVVVEHAASQPSKKKPRVEGSKGARREVKRRNNDHAIQEQHNDDDDEVVVKVEKKKVDKKHTLESKYKLLKQQYARLQGQSEMWAKERSSWKVRVQTHMTREAELVDRVHQLEEEVKDKQLLLKTRARKIEQLMQHIDTLEYEREEAKHTQPDTPIVSSESQSTNNRKRKAPPSTTSGSDSEGSDDVFRAQHKKKRKQMLNSPK